MPNILDYLAWRGDLTFQQCPFNDVDALVLSRLAYAPMDGIVSEDFSRQAVPLDRAAGICVSLVNDKGGGRSFRMKEDEALLMALAGSPRFANAELTGYINRFNAAREEQFSALTLLLPEGEGLFVAYRGTDGTLVGWKEDFSMGFADVVPAQLDAVDYLSRAAAAFSGPIRVGGHSKGGNLAVYAAAFCNEPVQKRILAVRNNDGPGFMAATIDKPGFGRIIRRVHTILPQSSVVGMLLEHEEDYSIVHSTSTGVFQHDLYSWQVNRAAFVPMEERTNSSRFIDATLKDWMKNMSPALREKMIDGVFSVLEASGGTSFRELWSAKNTLSVIRAARDLDGETKDLLKQAYDILRLSAKNALPVLLEGLGMPKALVEKAIKIESGT